MAYIVPNSTVILCKYVPLDSSYKNTIYFTSTELQSEYFMSMGVKRFDSVTYQRVRSNTIRVEAVADDIYDCNYMMFRNTSFGNKWFYAFINGVTYINNVTSEISYSIDVMQTWFFEATVNPCFVEREHTNDDTIGSNIAPEGLECGEYIGNGYTGMSAELDEGTYSLSELCVIIAVCDTDNVADGSGSYTVDMHTYDGVFSGSVLWAFQKSDISGIEALITTYLEAGKPDAIVNMYMLPILALGFVPDTGGTKLEYYATNCMSYVWTLDDISEGLTLDGYTPKNNKLYTYPYSFLGVDNGSGESMTLRYEFFIDVPRVTIHINIGYPITATARPANYMNSETVVNNVTNVTLTQYPQCSWNADYYSAWVAQNSVPMAISAGTSIANVMANTLGSIANTALKALNGATSGGLNILGNSTNTGLATTSADYGAYSVGSGSSVNTTLEQIGASGLTSASTTALSYVGNLLSSSYTASIHADISGGTYNLGNINCACGRQNFFASRYSISEQYARQIDDYFSRYGYAVRRIKEPNRNVREEWTYTKTVDCFISGHIPEDERIAMQNVYDNGITFWRNPSHVGQFNLDNPIG